MDAMEVELDNIEIEIQQLQDIDEHVNIFREELKSLRKELESKQSAVSGNMGIMARIADLSSRVMLYKSKGLWTEPKASVEKELSDAGNLTVNEKMLTPKNEYIEILKAFLQKVHEFDDVDKKREWILHVESKFKGSKILSQEFDQILAKEKYDVMVGLLQSGKMDDAKEFAKSFEEDMKIYIVKRFKGKVKELTDTGKPELAEFLYQYIYENAHSEESMQFWEKIMKIEHPEFNLPIIESKDSEQVDDKQKQTTGIHETEESALQLAVVPKKKNFFGRWLDEVRTKREEERTRGIKTFVIRYDSKEPGGMKKRDVMSFRRYIKRLKVDDLHERKNGIRIIFEEGITCIDDLLRKRKNIKYFI